MTSIDYAERFRAASSFEKYLSTVEKNADLWRAVYRRAAVPPHLAARAASLGRVQLLALSEDWCGDAVNTIPVVARLAESAPNLEFRLLGRDTNLDIMDEHLSGPSRASRAIPVVIALDESFAERGWWGSRPSVLQRWVETEGATLEKTDRYARIRQWYARDRGRSTLDEIVAMIERGAALPTGA